MYGFGLRACNKTCFQRFGHVLRGILGAKNCKRDVSIAKPLAEEVAHTQLPSDSLLKVASTEAADREHEGCEHVQASVPDHGEAGN